MSLEVAIVGLPNSGKSTLFNALLGRQIADVAEYPFTTIEPNVGVVEVPDERLSKLAEIVGKVETGHAPSLQIKIVPAAIKFIDIAGLVKDAHKGAGLGNQFLAKIRECSAILHVVREFVNPQVAHVMGDINTERDIEIINEELRQANIEKPTFVYQNKDYPNDSTLDLIIKECYKLLDLITMFTIVGGKSRKVPPTAGPRDPRRSKTSTAGQERAGLVQAWPVKLGLTIWQAAGIVHSDFQEKFIKAEIINVEKVVEVGSYSQAKAKGQVWIEGKDYILADGDVVTVKI